MPGLSDVGACVLRVGAVREGFSSATDGKAPRAEEFIFFNLFIFFPLVVFNSSGSVLWKRRRGGGGMVVLIVVSALFLRGKGFENKTY